MYENELKRLEETVMASVSPYHCILERKAQLEKAGFQALELGGRVEIRAWKGILCSCF